MKHTQPDLSIIIPAYQEAALIQSTLHSLAAWLDQHDMGVVEVIVTVADSPDGTARLAGECAGLFSDFTVLDVGPRRGKGHNVTQGMLAAQGHYRLFMDADLATPLRHLDDVQKCIAQGVDVAAAVRPLHIVHKGRLRRYIAEIGNLLIRGILWLPLSDTQCGFKLFSAAAADKIFRNITIQGWGFDIEALALARKSGYRIATFAVPDWYDPKPAHNGLTGDSVIGVTMQVALSLLRIRWQLFRGKYNLSR